MSIDSFAAQSQPHDGCRTFRPTIMGTRHMVSTGHYLAAQAGFQILEAGGNAVDAGVAAGLALGVVQSDLVSIAGVAPIMLFLAERQQIVTIDGLGVWPRAANCELFENQHEGKIPEGLLRTVVPAAPDAWITALEHYGTMTFGEVAGSAIGLARDGFPMHGFMSDRLKEAICDYARWPSNAAIFLPGGRPPEPGDIFYQKDLGQVLQYMADQERQAGGRKSGLQAARDAFYRGDIASRIVEFHRQNGGLLCARDLADFRVRSEPPARLGFGDFEVYACGPWCQGPVLPQALQILAGDDLRALGHNSAGYIHLLTEALKLSFADRERFYGDPAFVSVPLAQLLSPGYARQRRSLIREQEAWPEMPPAGRLGRGSRPAPESPGAGARSPDEPGTDWGTSYVCVVDRFGNAFSATPSDVSRDTPIIPGTGLAVSSRGSQSRLDRHHPACLAPGKRPRLTPSPAIVLKNGRAFMPFGTPGGDVQPQAMLQVLLNILVFRMDPQQAVESPRFASFSFPDSFAPHRYYPGRLQLEAPIGAETGRALQDRAHQVEWWPAWTWRAGAVCLIVVDADSGVLYGAADPRRPAYAVGW